MKEMIANLKKRVARFDSRDRRLYDRQLAYDGIRKGRLVSSAPSFRAMSKRMVREQKKT